MKKEISQEIAYELLEACKMMLTKTLLMNPEETKQITEAITKAEAR